MRAQMHGGIPFIDTSPGGAPERKHAMERHGVATDGPRAWQT